MSYESRHEEMSSLPEDILALHYQAFQTEMGHHIFENFGYSIDALDDDQVDDLYNLYFDQEALADDRLLVCVPACRAFVAYVKANGGPEEFGLTETSIAEWIPRTE